MASTRDSPWDQAVRHALSSSRGDGLQNFVLKCEDREWRVHSWVLSMHSDVLSEMCHGPFKETQDKAIVLKADDPVDVEAMLQYFYKASYDVISTQGTQFEELCIHCAVCIIADKYSIIHLQQHANTLFRTVLPFVTCSPSEVAKVATMASDAAAATTNIRREETSTTLQPRSLIVSRETTVSTALSHPLGN